MKRIGKSKHPHVVGLFGCVTIPEPFCIVLEYLKYGNLLTYLQSINEEVTLRLYMMYIYIYLYLFIRNCKYVIFRINNG